MRKACIGYKYKFSIKISNMPKRCAAFGSRGNYAGEPYTRTVSFPRNEEERNRWIDAMPNDRETVKSKRTRYMRITFRL